MAPAYRCVIVSASNRGVFFPAWWDRCLFVCFQTSLTISHRNIGRIRRGSAENPHFFCGSKSGSSDPRIRIFFAAPKSFRILRIRFKKSGFGWIRFRFRFRFHNPAAGTVQISVSSSLGFSSFSQGKSMHSFLKVKSRTASENQAAPDQIAQTIPTGFSAIESSDPSMKTLTPPTDQYAGSIVDFIAFNLPYSPQTG